MTSARAERPTFDVDVFRAVRRLAMYRPGAPWLLDAFCGAGGAAMGYWLAGFNVLGVDIKPQKNYPFMFIQGDALVLACDPATRAALGFASNKALLAAIGAATGLSKRTLDYRRAVALAFGPEPHDLRRQPVRWNVYRAATETDNPHYWLTRAVDGNLSADKLRGEYKLTTGHDPETVTVDYVTRTADATVTVVDHNKMVLRFDEKIGPVSVGDRVQVTITRVQAIARLEAA